MPNTFPYLGSYGFTDRPSYRRLIHEYADNTYRAYARSSVKHHVIDWQMTSASKTKRDAVAVFFDANWNLEFYFYLWPEASAVDSGGSSTTGRHLARFDADPELSIVPNGSCSYDLSVTIVLLS
jgi:hypothetical protein